jgi:hypothetical protein
MLTLLLGCKEKGLGSLKGIYCLMPKDAAAEVKLIDIPYINGFAIRTGWQKIEAREGEFDWSYIDGWIDALNKTNKKLILCIVAGVATPDWVYYAGAEDFEFIYKKRFYKMPMPWDKIYLDKWCSFIRALGRRYNKEDSIICIRITGAGFAGEMHLPKGRKNIKRWLRVGYSREKIVNVWTIIIDAYKEAFTDKALSIAIANPLMRDGAVNEILAYGMETLGQRFCIQGNWLSAKTSFDFPLYKLIKEYSKKTTVGFQMLAPFINKARMGEAKEAIDIGLAAGASYFEIYRGDIKSQKFKDILEYLYNNLKEKSIHAEDY